MVLRALAQGFAGGFEGFGLLCFAGEFGFVAVVFEAEVPTADTEHDDKEAQLPLLGPLPDFFKVVAEVVPGEHQSRRREQCSQAIHADHFPGRDFEFAGGEVDGGSQAGHESGDEDDFATVLVESFLCFSQFAVAEESFEEREFADGFAVLTSQEIDNEVGPQQREKSDWEHDEDVGLPGATHVPAPDQWDVFGDGDTKATDRQDQEHTKIGPVSQKSFHINTILPAGVRQVAGHLVFKPVQGLMTVAHRAVKLSIVGLIEPIAKPRPGF